MSTKSILVIDDEPNLCLVIQASLETMGNWQVITAESGKKGLQLAQTEQPDAILLDVMMPDMDGLTLLKELQNSSSTQKIPVILLTAKVFNNNITEFDQLGIAGVIAKPFDPMTLTKEVSKVLDWS